MNEAFDGNGKFPDWLTLSWAWEQAMDEPEAVKAAIGANLRRLREERRMTQRDLADLSETRLGQIKDVESARALPDIALMLSLARSLDVPCTNFLQTADGTKHPSRDVNRPVRSHRELQEA
jgi:transcriptional regulator with XRE-family HTH domain